MQKGFEELYKDFLADIDDAKQAGMTETERVEKNFWRAKNYWETLKVFIRANQFADDAAEIQFFRNVKPAFTSHIEYNVLISHALIAAPAKGLSEVTNRIVDFWKEEGRRCQRFFDKQKQFIAYYESGNKELDEVYFLRRNNTIDVSMVSLAPVYEEDNEFCTYADPLLRSYLAYKKYNLYVTKQISALQTSETT